MRNIKGKTIVELEKTHDDKIGSIFIDNEFNQTYYARIYGKVAASDICPVGQRCYFHYLSIGEDQIFEHEGKLYCGVHDDMVFCWIDENSKIKTTPSWCFVKPVEEHDQTIIVDGKRVQVQMTQSGLITGTGHKGSGGWAEIVAIDSPVYEAGQKVYMRADYEFMNKIEGEEYATCRVEDILGEYEELKSVV